VTESWWKLPYGEKKYIANTESTFIFYHARSDSWIWAGDYKFRVPGKDNRKGHTNKDGKIAFRKKKIRDVVNLTCKK
jgi:hypothetical protein